MRKVATAVAKKAQRTEDDTELDLRNAKIVGRGLRKNRKLPLRALREAQERTQEEVASAADMKQGDVSRLEQRRDLLISTLRRYLAALDADLEISAVTKDGRRVTIDL